jgi:hypothetical protein
MLQSRRNVPLQDIKSRMRSFFGMVLSACLANVLGLLLHQVPHENPHRDMCINGALLGHLLRKLVLLLQISRGIVILHQSSIASMDKP